MFNEFILIPWHSILFVQIYTQVEEEKLLAAIKWRSISTGHIGKQKSTIQIDPNDYLPGIFHDRIIGKRSRGYAA